jgi:hypothetical protein
VKAASKLYEFYDNSELRGRVRHVKSSGNKPVSSITVQDLEDFQAYMNKEGLSDRTIANRIGEVVTLLHYF